MPENYELRGSVVVLRAGNVLLCREENGLHRLPWAELGTDQSPDESLQPALEKCGVQGKTKTFLGSCQDRVGESERTYLMYLLLPQVPDEEAPVRWVPLEEARGIVHWHDSLALQRTEEYLEQQT